MQSIHLLGSARIENSAGRISGAAAQRHRIALLAYLSVARNGTAPRETLLALLWPEQGDTSARHLLNVSAHVIRKALGDDVLLTEGSDVRLDTTLLGSDVAAFRGARSRGDLRQAIDAYGGPFLDGFFLDGAAQFDQWQTAERARLASEFDDVLHAHAESAEQAGDWREAVHCWRRLVDMAGDRAGIVLRLMRALDEMGDRAGAIRAADAHAELLQREFEAAPSDEVVKLAALLRSRPSTEQLSARAPRPSASAPLTADGQGRTAESWEPTAESQKPRAIRLRLIRTGALVAAMAAVIVAATARWGGTATPSVAVLPFMDLSPLNDQAHLGDGLTEELLNALSRIQGLGVAARSSSFQFRDPGVDIREVGRKLGVGAVVEGSVRLEGDRLRVTAQLIDARNGFHLWSKQYDRRLVDVFALQEEIAREVASALSAQLVRGLPHELVARATTVPEAYQLYLRGRLEWNKRSREGIVKAADAFEKAVALDPRYAAAYAGLADAYQLLPDYANVPAREGLARARAAALRAIALDSTLASAHAALGAVLDDYDRDRAGSEQAYRTAIALNPAYATARQWLAIHLADDGNFDEALDEIERARRLDPLSPIISTAAGAVRYFARDYAGAIAEYQAVLRERPDFSIATALMGRVMLVAGRTSEAVATLRQSVEQSGGDPSYVAVYAAALAAAGQQDSARALARRVEAVDGYVPFTELASSYLYLGDDAKALELFTRAFDERDPAVKHMKVEPLYDRIRADPRFQLLLRKAGHR